MGMFDTLRCHYPLPVEGANELEYQTKDLICFMDHYEIREDGTLWHEEYDVEDKSDPNAVGIKRWSGCMSRVNASWVPSDYTGEVRFYSAWDDNWLEWSAYFNDGMLQQVNLIKNEGL